MNLEFTAEAGFIMYIYAHDLNLARGSSVAPPALWEAQLTLILASPKPSGPTTDLLSMRKDNIFYILCYYQRI